LDDLFALVAQSKGRIFGTDCGDEMTEPFDSAGDGLFAVWRPYMHDEYDYKEKHLGLSFDVCIPCGVDPSPVFNGYPFALNDEMIGIVAKKITDLRQ
jgi:hypothetical protein